MENVKHMNGVNKLYDDVAELIETSKKNVMIQVNSELLILNWKIGNKIKNELLNNKKPEYGKKIIKELSYKLVKKYGRGYSYSNLYRMLQINEYFEDFEKFATLSQKIRELERFILEMDDSGIHVAQYLTKYIPKELLQEKLLCSIENAKEKFEQNIKNK